MLFRRVSVLAICLVVLAGACVFPVSAGALVPVGETALVTFGEWALTDVAAVLGESALSGLGSYAMGKVVEIAIDKAVDMLSDSECDYGSETSSEHVHSFSYDRQGFGVEDGQRKKTIYFKCACGQTRSVTVDEFDSAYNDYVDSLPASGISSDGGLIWTPSISECSSFIVQAYSTYWCDICSGDYSNEGGGRKCTFTGNGRSVLYYVSNFESPVLGPTRIIFNAPISGVYCLDDTVCCSGSGVDDLGRSGVYSWSYSSLGSNSYNADESVDIRFSSNVFLKSPKSLCAASGPGGIYQGSIYLPSFRVVPASGVVNTSSDTTYNNDSRVGSITGDYGIVGDNGTISVVENVTIVNEENNTFYNPATGDTVPITSWTYDYADRSYDLQLGDDVGVKVKFDDAALTLDFSQGDTVEGDTVNNHYTYYYVTEYTNNSGGEDPEPTASPVPTDAPTPTDTPTPTDAPVPTDDPDNPVVVVIPTPVPVIADVPDGILTLRERLRELYNNLVEMLGDASSFLSDAFSFVPQEIGWLIEFSFALAIVVGIFRMFWK